MKQINTVFLEGESSALIASQIMFTIISIICYMILISPSVDLYCYKNIAERYMKKEHPVKIVLVLQIWDCKAYLQGRCKSKEFFIMTINFFTLSNFNQYLFQMHLQVTYMAYTKGKNLAVVCSGLLEQLQQNAQAPNGEPVCLYVDPAQPFCESIYKFLIGVIIIHYRNNSILK